MEEMEMMETAVAAMAETVMAAKTEMAAVGTIEIACWRGCWPISSVSETGIIWNITPDLSTQPTPSTCNTPTPDPLSTMTSPAQHQSMDEHTAWISAQHGQVHSMDKCTAWTSAWHGRKDG
jgi:hypothetical protein